MMARGRGRGRGPAAPAPTIRLVACGNPDRGDDGLAGVAMEGILATLPAEVRATVDVRTTTELRVEDLLDLRPGCSLVIVDAVSGVEPGTVVQRPLEALIDPGRGSVGSRPIPRSSHQLPIELVLGLAASLLGRSIEGTFIGLGGASFGFAAGLSDAVSAGLPALRSTIAGEVERLAVATRSVAGPAG